MCVQADGWGECAVHFHRMVDQECSFQIMNRSLRVTPVQRVLTVLGLTVCQSDPRSWLTPGLALVGSVSVLSLLGISSPGPEASGLSWRR